MNGKRLKEGEQDGEFSLTRVEGEESGGDFMQPLFERQTLSKVFVTVLTVSAFGWGYLIAKYPDPTPSQNLYFGVGWLMGLTMILGLWVSESGEEDNE